MSFVWLKNHEVAGHALSFPLSAAQRQFTEGAIFKMPQILVEQKFNIFTLKITTSNFPCSDSITFNKTDSHRYSHLKFKALGTLIHPGTNFQHFKNAHVPQNNSLLIPQASIFHFHSAFQHPHAFSPEIANVSYTRHPQQISLNIGKLIAFDDPNQSEKWKQIVHRAVADHTLTVQGLNWSIFTQCEHYVITRLK